MTIQTADRLVKLRKEKGLSQEQLAEKLGVSRQAVSKWERAEATPDMDNLIALAGIYDISLDELLGLEKQQQKNQAKKGGIHIKNDEGTVDISFKDGVHVDNGKDQVNISFKDGVNINTRESGEIHTNLHDHIFKRGADDSKKLSAAVWSAVPVISFIAFILVGSLADGGWRVSWIILLMIPVIGSVYEAVRLRRLSAFCYPVLVAAVYLTVGMLFSVWHPTWVMFITIPIFYSIAKVVDG